MDKNADGVRIEFDDSELLPFASPEALTRAIMSNYGVKTIVPDEFLQRDPEYEYTTRGALMSGSPTIPRKDYENTLIDAKMAFEGDKDYVESINSLYKKSLDYAKKQKKFPKPLSEEEFQKILDKYGK